MAIILGIESSCDETAASVVEDGRVVHSNVIASQHELHERYGGVVPEIASRAHMERISPVIDEALAIAGQSLGRELGFADVDAIAVGNRPGLIGSLLVGLSAAKAMAWSLGKPLIGVDHVRAHLHAGSLVKASDLEAGQALPDPPTFPALGLVVSGGHSSIYSMTSDDDVEVLGRTIDDAVGEAYDKAAVILDIGYPGGPKLDKMARAYVESSGPIRTDLPRSMLGKDSLDFSFSGLKTALLYTVRGKPQGRGKDATFERSAADLTEEQKAELAAAFQQASIETVITKLGRAIDRMASRGIAPRSLIIGGGVSANSLLRQRATELGGERGLAVFLPGMAFCLDNAAMIAGFAHSRLQRGERDGLDLPAVATTGG